MALVPSPSEWFVPKLQELMDSEKTSIRRCVWHKSRRSTQSDSSQLIRCSCRITEQDARRADQLIRELRDVMDHEDRHSKVTREISQLLLCKIAHRSLNAGTISDFWATELTSMGRNTTREGAIHSQRPASPRQSAHISSVGRVQEELGLALGNRIQCHGRGSKGDCGNWINKSNGERIVAITKELAVHWRFSTILLDSLEELSDLIMCQRWHQDQAPAKLKEWISIIKAKEASKKAQVIVSFNPQTPARQRSHSPAVETPETQTSSIWASPRRRHSPLSTATTPQSTPPSGQTGVHSLPNSNDELRQKKIYRFLQQSCVSPTPVSSRTRAATEYGFQLSPATSKSPTFEPLTTVKSSLKAAEHVMDKIKAQLSTNEIPSGFVYGFRRPGCDLIKIGTTRTTVAERLKAIGTRCNYKLNVVFQVATDHAMKVEHLVHRHFYKQNRRECLVDGLCNEGRGCATRHKEWLEGVSDAYAEAVVRAWVRWMNLEPYDAEGLLKPVWLVRTKHFNLSAAGDIRMRWTEIKLLKTVKDTEEGIDEAIKAEKVLRRVSELSRLLVPPKSVSTTTRTISGSGFATPVSMSSPVDVFA